MNYKTLKSIFYSDSDSYESEYLSRFNCPAAIKFGIDINGNPSFMLVTPEILEKQFQILKSNEKLNALLNGLPKIVLEQYMKKCLIEEVVLTNEIEGVISTKQDVFEVLSSQPHNSKQKRLVGLVTKYHKLADEKLSFKTNQDIRNIYDDLVMEEIKSDDPDNIPDGVFFRKHSVNVVSKFGKKIHSGIMPEEAINSAMSSALDILNNDNLNILIRIAVFHCLFGYIHPFYDGNGRTSRFISSYMLTNNFNVLTGYRLAYVIKENLAVYYNSFKEANEPKNKGDLTPFVIDFFEILVKLFNKLIGSVSERAEQLDYYHKICDKLFADNDKYANVAYTIVLQTLFGVNGISVRELSAALNYSEYAVRGCISQLNKKQLLAVTKHGNKYFYNIGLDKLGTMWKKP